MLSDLHDNENVVLLKPEMLKIRALRQGHLLIEGEENILLSKVRKAKEFDEDVIKAVEELKKTGTKTLRSDEWSLKQDLVLFRGKVYVPKDSKLQMEIIKLHHDTPDFCLTNSYSKSITISFHLSFVSL